MGTGSRPGAERKQARNHHGRGRGHDGAEEGEPDPEGEVNPSAGLPACVLEVRGPSTWRTVCLSSPEGERLGEGGGSVNFGRLCRLCLSAHAPLLTRSLRRPVAQDIAV